MPITDRRFNEDLAKIGADVLKLMARMWGASPKIRKAESIELISNGLASPEKVRAALQILAPWELTALALLKQAGGVMDAKTLFIELAALGTELPPRLLNVGDGGQDVINHLLRAGLLLIGNGYSPDSMYDYSYRNTLVYSDERLLAQAERPAVTPFSMQAIPAPATTVSRRAQAVMLDVVRIVQSLASMGGLKLTKTGQIRAGEVNKFAKALQWNEEKLVVDDFVFPVPVVAWLSVLQNSGLVETTESSLQLKRAPALTPVEQVRILLDGFIRIQNWSETQGNVFGYSYYATGYMQGRAIVRTALAALPQREVVYRHYHQRAARSITQWLSRARSCVCRYRQTRRLQSRTGLGRNQTVGPGAYSVGWKARNNSFLEATQALVNFLNKYISFFPAQQKKRRCIF